MANFTRAIAGTRRRRRRFEQSGVFNKRYGGIGLFGFRHEQTGQGRLDRL